MTDLAQFNLFDAQTQQCPFPFYEAMRSTQPVFQVSGMPIYLVTRYEDVVACARNTKVFSNRFSSFGPGADGPVNTRLAEIAKTGYPPVSTMLTADPPEHTRYRSTVNKAFTPSRVAALRPTMVAVTEALIDEFIDDGVVEVVKQFAVGLPVQVIADALGVPRDRKGDFKRWSDDSIATIGATPDDDRRIEAALGIVEFQHYFAAELEIRRTHPTGDLLSDLVNATIDNDAGEAQLLTTAELLSILQQILVAGNETTTKLITESLRLLAEHPAEWARLRAEPGRAADVVEEALRLSTPTQGMFRAVTEDVEVAGTLIPKGSMAVLMYCSANRDESLFTDPDAFSPSRANLKRNIAFGSGIHFCLGAALARAEAIVAVECLANRVESIELAAGNALEYEPSFILRGLKSLTLNFTRC